MAGRHTSATGTVATWSLRLVVVAALAVDAVVHLRLASDFDFNDAGIGAGNLFRIQSAVAIGVGLYVLVRGTRLAHAVAFLVTFSAVVAVVLYRYVEVPQLGPIPPLYEPVWYFEKSLSAVAEGIGALAALTGVLLSRRRPRSAGTP